MLVSPHDNVRRFSAENGAAANALAEPPSTASAPVSSEEETHVGGGAEKVATEEVTEAVAPREIAIVERVEEEEDGDANRVDAVEETPTMAIAKEDVAEAGQ